MFRSHPEQHLYMRLHGTRSLVLTSQELVELRAAQRTFEGAYIRTALGQFSFALVILKIFTAEFYPIGALFAIYGVAILLVAIHRRYEGQRQFFTAQNRSGRFKPKFRTSGDTVTLLTGLSLCAYLALLVLTWRLVF
ncbi:unnamed protein product [Clonostachys rosea]|uniref:DUF202 domain-containing protein n=1 Tax=Bionectria ochroleuca TaxID=29856 RepID=A0ABY6U7I4_BIOOC|nr:unnamed protein product [Clonostachys rosea]